MILIVTERGLDAYVDGKIVGTIPVSQFPSIILDMVKVLRNEVKDSIAEIE